MSTPIERIEQYVFEFFSSRMENINMFYYSVSENRQFGIYKLKNGTRLMDFLNTIHGNIEEKLYSKRLIPQRFSTPKDLFDALTAFKNYLIQNEQLLIDNLNGERTSYIVSQLIDLKDEIIHMIDYAKELYEIEDSIIPYQDLRVYLIRKEIPKFIETLKSIIASVSYSISKSKEGYHHSNIHLILKILGFEIISEEQTNVGRIDAVIRFLDTIYILEFKLSENENVSDIALSQIKEKNYPQKFFVEKKKIIGIGISFSEKDRNINGFQIEEF
jgi:hypothetical protein